MENPYKTLGLEKGASQEQIKRAYRRLAHQHHPDKGGDADKFKEINEAYQILSDPQKKAQYDQFGSAGFGQGSAGGSGGFGGFGGFEDIFGKAGTGQGGFSFSFGGGGLGDIFGDIFEQARANVQAEVEIPLTTALLGGEVVLKTQESEEIKLKIRPCTSDGTTFRLRGKGGQTRKGRGDLTLIVRVRFPRRLSREQKRIIEDLKLTGL